jgi:AcrR family transcriptional regulator
MLASVNAGSAGTLTIERRLTRAQAQRRERVSQAARELAERGGSAAVTMDAVAERSGVARATIYRYFASKDHLLAELAVGWAAELAADLRADPPPGARPAERVAGSFRRVMQAALARPRLTAAIVASTLSSEPEAVRAQRRFASILPQILDGAIGGAPIARRAEVEAVMAHVLFSALVNTTTGRLQGHEAVAALEAAAELLFVEEPRP